MKTRKKWLIGGLAAILLALAGVAVAQLPNTLNVSSSPSGTPPAIRASGIDANIGINLVPKGSGTVQVNGTPIVVGGGTTTSLTINPGPLAVTGTTNLTGPLFMTPGASVALEQVGGVVLANSSTNATTTLVATEQDLFNFTVLANTLSANNQFLKLTFRDRNAATANTKQLRIYFGATVIGNSTAVGANNNFWNGDCIIWRTGAATQKSICNVQNITNVPSGGTWSTGAGGGAEVTTPAETLSGPVVLRITGTDAVAAGGSNLEGVNLLWYPAGQ